MSKCKCGLCGRYIKEEDFTTPTFETDDAVIGVCSRCKEGFIIVDSHSKKVEK